MGLKCEEFFIDKIKSTLARTPAPLTEREETILRSRVSDLNAAPAELRALNERCVAALRKRFDSEIETGKWAVRSGLAKATGADVTPVDYALEWRRYNVELYELSECAITGVVQNWYLTVGRKQELRASPVGRLGCGAALLQFAVTFGVLGFVVTGC